MESKTSFDDLSEKLVMDILSRLPVKTLIRSTAVRKKWYSIIRSVSFISLHLSRSVSDPSRYYIFLTNDSSHSFGLVRDNDLLTSSSPEHIFFKSNLCGTKFVGACMGLVCLKDNGKHGDDIYLVNPFTRKERRRLNVECSCYANLIDGMEETYGSRIRIAFGYSEGEEDHKVLRMITPDYFQEQNTSLKTKHLAEIYSLKTKKWKRVDVPIHFELESHYSATCAHSCLYWCLKKKKGKEAYLLCFDLNSELFSEIELPETYHKLSGSVYRHNTFNRNNSLVVVLFDDPFASGKVASLIINICLLEKNPDGWRESCYKCSRLAFYSHDPYFGGYWRKLKALGFNVCGKLIFEVHPDKGLDDIDDVHDNSRRNDYMLAVDLQEECEIQEFAFRFITYFKGRNYKIEDVHAATNMLESLLLFSDPVVRRGSSRSLGS